MDRTTKYTKEYLFDKEVLCYQHTSGFRYSMDAVLLDHFMTLPDPDRSIVDLGTGCGKIPLILAHRYPNATCTGVEIQPALATLSQHIFSVNRFANRLAVISR